jgi:transposase
MDYFNTNINKLKRLKQMGYNFVGVDVGIRYFATMIDIDDNLLRYSLGLYHLECNTKKYEKKENELNNLILKFGDYPMPVGVMKKCKRLKKQLIYHSWSDKKRSFDKFIDRVKSKFGDKIVLCIGDKGRNEINIEFINYLSRHFISYQVNEDYTSKFCSECGIVLEPMIIDGEKILRLVRCPNPECVVQVRNKDTNAVRNILYRVLNEL